VALKNSRIHARECFNDPDSAARWCREIGAAIVGVDAPCCWSSQRCGCGRKAEKDIRDKAGLHSFSTPSETIAKGNSFYAWMINGRLLYNALSNDYPLYIGRTAHKRFCFETYPHAIVWGLLGHTLPAREKRSNRRTLLEAKGIDCTALTNVDWRDAALCALTAAYMNNNRFVAFGDGAEGFIVLPTRGRLGESVKR
jgi:predicted nuclease with RNAse H fold